MGRQSAESGQNDTDGDSGDVYIQCVTAEKDA
jgi:hypothetical protein